MSNSRRLADIIQSDGDLGVEGSIQSNASLGSIPLYGRGRTGNLDLSNTSTGNTDGGWLSFSGNMSNPTPLYQMASITAGKDTTEGDNNYAGHLSFWTTSGGANGEANSGQYERVRIDGLGRMGIGTDSPTSSLEVSRASGWHGIKVTSDGESLSLLHSGLDASIENSAAGSTRFYNNGLETMRIASAGNVGIDAVPPNLHGNIKALSIGNTAIFGGYGNSIGDYAFMHSNIYFDEDGNYKYLKSDYISMYEQLNGSHIWYNATAGTAGENIVPTENMRINTDGNVGIGTDNPTHKLSVVGSLNLNDGSDAQLTISTSGTGDTTFFTNNGLGTNATYGQYIFLSRRGSNPTLERMRINSLGKVGIGTANVYGNLHLHGGQQDVVLTNQNADGVAGTSIGRFIGQARGYSNEGAEMASIDFQTNSAAWYKGDIVFKTNGTDGTNPALDALERVRIDAGGRVIRNGMITHYVRGSGTSAIEFSYDFPFGPVNPFKVTCAASHWTGGNYRAIREAYVTTDSYGNISVLDVVNDANVAFFGGWTFSQPDSTTLRITKTAGSNSYSMVFWIKVEHG